MRKNQKHEFVGTSFYTTFYNIRNRCKTRKIVFGWKNFIEFKNDMYDSYRRASKSFNGKTVIDRHDTNGPFDKKNCFWNVRSKHSSVVHRQKVNKKELLSFIKEYYQRYGESPSVRLLSKHAGTSTMSIYYWLRRFDASGEIHRHFKNTHRSGFSIPSLENVKKRVK